MAEVLGQGRYLRLLAEKAAVHIGQLLQPRPGVFVALLVLGVEPNKQVLEAVPKVVRREVRDVVAKGVGGNEPRVLTEHEKHETRHEHGKRVVVLGRVGVIERLGHLLMELRHDLARLDGNGTGDRGRGLRAALEELDGGEVLGELGKRQLEERLPAERIPLTVKDPEIREVAGDDIARLLREGHALSVSVTLLRRRHLASLACLLLGKIDSQ